MSAPTVEVESRRPVAVVTLNRPDFNNTLNLQTAMDLLAAAMTCARNPDIRSVVLTGAGRNFCFGGDLRGMLNKGKSADAYLRELPTYLHEAISHFARMDAPVIASWNSFRPPVRALGLMAMADLALLWRDVEVQSGLHGRWAHAGCGHVVLSAAGDPGPSGAMELFLLNRSITATEGIELGPGEQRRRRRSASERSSGARRESGGWADPSARSHQAAGGELARCTGIADGAGERDDRGPGW